MINFHSGIKLRQLQYFLAVAETLHFSKAAERLFVTQPTLSHQIAELETHIGMPLFDRAGKNVRITEAGEVFAAFATRALRELEGGCIALRELEGLQRGTLNIGASQSFVRKLFPPILGEFINRFPAIKLNIEEMTASEIETRLANGSLDLGIAFEPSVLEDTELEPLLKERLFLVVGHNNKFATRTSVRLIELSGEPMVFFTRVYSTRTLVDQFFDQAKATLNVVCETNSIDVMLGVVSQTNVATILPEGTIEKRPNIHVLPILDPVPMRVSALLWSRHSFRTFAARTFAQMVREHFISMLPFQP
ncbi:transcriptional regulator CynR [Glaciimonas sp. PCH181]|uniref:transcriptional regulator CynR n=1 Tax=Glaciimonas sp. PCH181 TaxID=2133943 RepID=UPI000D363C3B|nr:transcriptional regulator CynR [Glaciimonas sp. PCH181]PUA19480.1 transcriptional regulator CynR [Glaciimonas sp. PCH181]